MVKRRNFIREVVLGTVSTLVPIVGKSFSRGSRKEKLPLVVATWDNRKATRAGMNVLLNGGSALDAVEAGAKVPEADPEDTSVGYGGLPDRDGIVSLDACIMNEKGEAGSVTFLQHIKHPISVARKVMEDTPHVMLSGKGALDFAISKGFVKENLLSDTARDIWEKWMIDNDYRPLNHDTIGILAIDNSGNISGACSTSGLAFKLHGRVGDSPVIGAGMYVDNDIGGACATGHGELVMKTLGSFLIVELMRQGMSPNEACKMAIERIMHKFPELARGGSQVGYAAINKKGIIGGYSLESGYTIAVSNEQEDYLIVPEFHIKK